MDQDYGPVVFEIDDATPKAVAKKLRPFWNPETPKETWNNTRKSLGAQGGEVRRSDDWRQLQDEEVMIVAVTVHDECVIRWATKRGLEAVPTLAWHEAFLNPGDYLRSIWKGFAELTEDGKLQVRG